MAQSPSLSINDAALARLIVGLHLSQEELTARLAKQHPHLSPSQVNLTVKLLSLNQKALTHRRLQQQNYDRKTINQIIASVNPKKNQGLHQTIPAQAEKIITSAIAATGTPYTLSQKQAAIEKLILSSPSNSQNSPSIKNLFTLLADPNQSLKIKLTAAKNLTQTLSGSQAVTNQVHHAVQQSSASPADKESFTATLNQAVKKPTKKSLAKLTQTITDSPPVSRAIQTFPPPPSDPVDPETLQACLNSNPVFRSPVTELCQQIEKATHPLTKKGLAASLQQKTALLVDPLTLTTTDLSQLSPEKQNQVAKANQKFTSKLIHINPDFSEELASFYQKTKQATIAISSAPQADQVISSLIPSVSPDFVKDFLAAARHDLKINLRHFPSSIASQASAIFQQLKQSFGATPNLYSQIDPQSFLLAAKHALQHKDSKLGRLLAQKPQQFTTAVKNYQETHNSQLGQQIRAQSPSPAAPGSLSAPSTISNKIGSFINQRLPQIPLIGKITPYLFHPVQALKSWFARQVGRRLVTRFYKAFAKRVTHKLAREAAKTILRQGLKSGIKFFAKVLAKESLKRGLQAILASTGVGAILAPIIEVVVEVGAFIVSKTIGLIKQGLNSLTSAIWGEKLKTRDIVLLPALIAASFTTALAAAAALAATTAAAAAKSLALTIATAAAITAFLYLSAFTIAPLIGSFVQLNLPTAGLNIGAGTYIPNPSDTFDDLDNQTGCFTFDNLVYPWSDQQKILLRPLINQLPQTLNQKICSGDNIQLVYGGSKGSQGGFVLDNTLTLYDAGHNLYTLAHESGHLLAHHYPHLYQDFANSEKILAEGFIHTYPLEKTINENFAEMIGLYVTNSDLLSSQYPQHYQFAAAHIFN